MQNIHYSMTIEWDPRDDIFVVTVPELEQAMTHGKTYVEAVKNAEEAIELWIQTSQELGELIPEPRTFADAA